ncbi:hypothetical protein V2G26_014352 [Clonostachys chloroleuca]
MHLQSSNRYHILTEEFFFFQIEQPYEKILSSVFLKSHRKIPQPSHFAQAQLRAQPSFLQDSNQYPSRKHPKRF